MSVSTAFTGHVDGVHEGDVQGWVINHGGGAGIEEVVCRGVHGSLSFHAVQHRRDVCALLGREGLFGFAVPLADLARLGPEVRFEARDGTPLDNGRLAVPEAKAAEPRDGPAHVFLHVQKAAGTSVASALVPLLPSSARLGVYPGPAWLGVQEVVALPIHQRRALRLVSGHLFFGFGQFLGRPVRYVTMLRDPMRRIASHYWHLRRWHPTVTRDGVPVRHSTLVNEALTDEFDNLQTRALAGLPKELVPIGRLRADDVALALFNVEHHFDAVGFAEEAQEGLDRICRCIGVPPVPLPRENVGVPGGHGDEDFRRLDWDRIRHANRHDIALHRELRALWSPAGVGGAAGLFSPG